MKCEIWNVKLHVTLSDSVWVCVTTDSKAMFSATDY